jgi:restriction endonuclease Mrr
MLPQARAARARITAVNCLHSFVPARELDSNKAEEFLTSPESKSRIAAKYSYVSQRVLVVERRRGAGVLAVP